MAFLIPIIFFLLFPGDSRAQSGLQELASPTVFRLPGRGGRPGWFEVVPLQVRPSVLWSAPEDPSPREERGALVVLDKRNPLPGIRRAGGNFVFFEDGSLVTVSADGMLFYHGVVDVDPGVSGGVWFVDSRRGELWVVDGWGFWMPTGIFPGPIRGVGGNFLLEESGRLTTIRSTGAAPGNPAGAAIVKEGWRFPQVAGVGGSFFWNEDGSVISIDSITGFFREPFVPDSRPLKAGGNYFIAEDGELSTVSLDGTIRKHPGAIPKGGLGTLGPSFLVWEDGAFLAVDSSGKLHRSWVRVSTTGVQARLQRALEADPEPGSMFVPMLRERERE